MNTQSLVPQVFNFKEHPMRSVVIKQEPWFVAKDVCDALDLQNSRDIVRRHLDDDERTVYEIHTPSRGNVRMTVVNMSGMYALMFRSQKPKAKMFRKWITNEVLPALRDTGTYTTPGMAVREEMAYRAAAQPAPAPKAKVLPPQEACEDVRHVPYDWIAFNGGRMRAIVVAGRSWYHLGDANACMTGARTFPFSMARRLPVANKRLLWVFAATNAAWFVDDTGLRMLMAARGISTGQLTLNLAH